jgi:hypothetical protein
MRALCWHGKSDVRVDTVPEPKIQHPRDAVIKSPPARSAAQIFISWTGISPPWRGATFSAMKIWARRLNSGPKSTTSRSATRLFPSQSATGNAGFPKRGCFQLRPDLSARGEDIRFAAAPALFPFLASGAHAVRAADGLSMAPRHFRCPIAFGGTYLSESRCPLIAIHPKHCDRGTHVPSCQKAYVYSPRG